MKTHEGIPTDDLLRELFADDEPIRISWDDTVLDIERPLPLLVVHRMHGKGDVTRRLLQGHSASFVVDPDQPATEIERIVGTVAEVQADRFDVFGLVELWAADKGAGDHSFVIGVPDPEELPEPVEVLVDGLSGPLHPATVSDRVAPPGLAPLIDEERALSVGCLVVGLEVPRIFEDPDSEAFFPAALTELRSETSRALQRFFFEFIRVHSNLELSDYRELGRRTIVEAGYEVDRRLAQISGRLNMLLHMTPVNTQSARDDFGASGYEKEPSFHYRLLPFDPDLVKRELYDLPLESVEDPTVASLLRAKRVEIDRAITMLEDRDTPRFLPGSIQTYGAVEAELVDNARHILDRTVPAPASEPAPIEEFARVARAEIDYYRQEVPELSSVVEIRPDMPGVVVSQGHLYLGAGGSMARSRIQPLLQHEVGTHVVTYFNGSIQPLSLLGVGLPGYEETQEGFAMFAEYMAGGLDAGRMRVIAARVIATRQVSDGGTFVEVFRTLVDELGFLPGSAWSITMRAARSGGSVKDAIYLRGLLGILEYIRDGGSLEPLLVGKIALEQVPLIQELLWRGVLHRPRLTPRWLEGPRAEERLAAARAGMTPLDLIGVES